MGFFSSWSLFSRPSTRLRRASRTSVLGPRFLGIASGAERGRLAKLGDHAKGRNPESAPAQGTGVSSGYAVAHSP